jgi:hypothetical protein
MSVGLPPRTGEAIQKTRTLMQMSWPEGARCDQCVALPEHHLLMAVPWLQPLARPEILLAKGPRMEIQAGYTAMLALVTSKPELSQIQAAA